MNHHYRVVWNASTECLQAVAETAKTHGKGHSSVSSGTVCRLDVVPVLTTDLKKLVLALIMVWGGSVAHAAPLSPVQTAAATVPTATSVVVKPLPQGASNGGLATFTDTTIATKTTNGHSVLDVTTKTISGNTGINYFSTFTVAGGDTVNLYLPTLGNGKLASNLVNLVDDKINVWGTVNGLSSISGKLAGNVIFASPNGMLVGNTGVLNMANLTVSTPSVSDMGIKVTALGLSNGMTTVPGAGDNLAQQLFTANSATASGVYSGTGSDGSIHAYADGAQVSVNGKITANGAVNLFAASVVVKSGASIEAGTDAALKVFNSTVNTGGLFSAGNIGDGIVRGKGQINLAATSGMADRTQAVVAGISDPGDLGKVVGNGRLAALMQDDGGVLVGGPISLSGGYGVALGDGARIVTSAAQQAVDAAATASVAAKNAASGDVSINAGFEITMSGNATIITSGGLPVAVPLEALGDSKSALTVPATGSTTNVRSTTADSANGGLATITQVTSQAASPSADSYYKAGSGNVTLSAPTINLQGTTLIQTVATDTATTIFKSGDIKVLASGDASCALCDPAAVSQLSSTLKLADVLSGIQPGFSPTATAGAQGVSGISVDKDVVLDARHRGVNDATAGLSKDSGNILLSAQGLNRQMGGYGISISTVDLAGSLYGYDVSVVAKADTTLSKDILSGLLTQTFMQKLIDAATDPNAADPAAAKLYATQTVFTALQNVLTPSTPTAGDLAGALDTIFAKNPAGLSAVSALIPYFAVSVAQADAKVNVHNTAKIHANNDIQLLADGERTVNVSDFKLPLVNGLIPFGLGISFGRVAGTTQTWVQSGAQLESGNNLSVRAVSNNQLSVTGSASNGHDTNGNQLTGAGFAVGVGNSDVTTRAEVDHDVRLTVGGGMDVTALTEQSLSTTASFTANGQGALGGPAIAFSFFQGETDAIMNADLSLSGSQKNLAVTALNYLPQQVTKAATQSGASNADQITQDFTASAKPLTDFFVDALKQFFTGKSYAPKLPTSTSVTLRVAGAVAGSYSEQSTNAVIGVDLYDTKDDLGNAIHTLGAPKINADGAVTVTAMQRQEGMHTSAVSDVNSSLASNDTAQNDNSKYSFSIGALYNQLDEHTHALIGGGSEISAGNFAVNAWSEHSLNLLGLSRWGSFNDAYQSVFKNVIADALQVGGNLSTLKSPSGALENMATTYAEASGAGDKLSLAGTVSVQYINTDTIAWVGDDVTLNVKSGGTWSSSPMAALNGSSALVGSTGKTWKVTFGDQTAINAPWTAIDTFSDSSTPTLTGFNTLTFGWNRGLVVNAANFSQELNIAGNPLSGLSNTAAGASSGNSSNTMTGSAAGGGINIAVNSNNVHAGIGLSGHVTAKDIDVNALQNTLLLGLSANAGAGPSLALEGSVVVNVDLPTVTASIDRSTAVLANTIDLKAEEAAGIWSVAGGIARPAAPTGGSGGNSNSSDSDVSIGAGLAINVRYGTVEALIGDTTGLRPMKGSAWNGVALSSTGLPATWYVDNLNVYASSDGQNGAFGIAGAGAKSDNSGSTSSSTSSNTTKDGATDVADGFVSAFKTTMINEAGSLGALLNDKVATPVKQVYGGLKSAYEQVKTPVASLKAVGAKIKGFFNSPAQAEGDSSSVAVAGSVAVNYDEQNTTSLVDGLVLKSVHSAVTDGVTAGNSLAQAIANEEANKLT